MKLLIYGAGGLGREYCDVANRINALQKRWAEIAFVDDNEALGKEYYGCGVYTFAALDALDRGECEFVVAVGNPGTRCALWQKMKEAGFKGATLVDPKSCVSPSAKVCEGAVISAFAFVSSWSTIGENSLVLPGAVVGHDTVIGAHSFVCCNATLGGNVKVGERVFFAENVPVREGLTIGTDSIMSLGAVILRDVPEAVVMFGNPARAMAKNEDKKVF